MRSKLSYSNVVSTLCLSLLLGGGAAYAAGHLGKNSVGSKQLKKNAVTTAKIKKEAVTAAKVKKGTLTGKQINASTLGVVPNAQNSLMAQTAQTANALAPSEGWHEIGAPGEPKFEQSWENAGGSTETAAFYKDPTGIVHLRGHVAGGIGALMFRLPPGYRPAPERFITFAVNCYGVDCANGTGEAQVWGSGFEELGLTGGVVIAASSASLNGIDFRAEG